MMGIRNRGLPSCLSVLVGCLLATTFGCSEPSTNDDPQVKDLNQLLSQRDQVTIRARLLANDVLLQDDTVFIDISPFKDLLVAMLLPIERSAIQDRYAHVYQLEITFRDERSLTLDGVWLGKGKPLVARGGRYCYGRTGPCYPLAKDKYVDETAVFCALVKALIDGDKERSAEATTILRQAVGLQPPER